MEPSDSMILQVPFCKHNLFERAKIPVQSYTIQRDTAKYWGQVRSLTNKSILYYIYSFRIQKRHTYPVFNYIYANL